MVGAKKLGRALTRDDSGYRALARTRACFAHQEAFEEEGDEGRFTDRVR